VVTVAGNVTGAFVLSTLVAFGLGPILQRSDLAFAAVQWGGGLYLVHLGIDAIRKRKVHAADMTNQGPDEPRVFQSVRDGFMVGVLNPKGLVFYAAVLPQFIDRDRGKITSQLIFLGALFSIFVVLILYSCSLGDQSIPRDVIKINPIRIDCNSI
jgi:threonine/homoserine/homoserine lactone efflux protein